MAEQGVAELTVDSRQHCLPLSPDQMDALQRQGASLSLDPGRYRITLQPLGTESEADSAAGHTDGLTEPTVMLWIYGGRVINQRTQVPVSATWASLQGYGDSLVLEVLEVLEATTLCAFFPPTPEGHVPSGEGLRLLIQPH